jgi:hypothetical protein
MENLTLAQGILRDINRGIHYVSSDLTDCHLHIVLATTNRSIMGSCSAQHFKIDSVVNMCGWRSSSLSFRNLASLRSPVWCTTGNRQRELPNPRATFRTARALIQI